MKITPRKWPWLQTVVKLLVLWAVCWVCSVVKGGASFALFYTSPHIEITTLVLYMLCSHVNKAALSSVRVKDSLSGKKKKKRVLLLPSPIFFLAVQCIRLPSVNTSSVNIVLNLIWQNFSPRQNWKLCTQTLLSSTFSLTQTCFYGACQGQIKKKKKNQLLPLFR